MTADTRTKAAVAPATVAEAADALGDLASEGLSVRVRGGGTKFSWGSAVAHDAELSTAQLDQVLEHNAADMTAVLQAGTPLSVAQARFAEAGQMLALDPPLGSDLDATIGGVLATADSGPSRHRYGGPRDLVLGMTVVLADRTVARSGGKVIKNVAGYDLAKLFTGSFGTLGLIAEVVVRLQPMPPATSTAVGRSNDPVSLQAAAELLAHAPIEAESLDVSWAGDGGAILARFGGAAAEAQANNASSMMMGVGLEVSIEDGDEKLWALQRSAQRAADGVILKIGALPSDLAMVLNTTRRLEGALVGRAALGLSWLRFATPDQDVPGLLEEIREGLRPRYCLVLDAPEAVRAELDVWGAVEDGALAVMRRIKQRFDPGAACAPALFVGGI